MGTLGVQEMLIIFLVALVLFGPKKLPELGKTIGKAITEFRRASNDLKQTFEREMQTMERENQDLKNVSQEVESAMYSQGNYQLSSADPTWGGEGYLDQSQHPAQDPSTVGASEVAGAESNGTATAAALAEPEPALEGTASESESGQRETSDLASTAVEATPDSEAPQRS
jgi:sec-independent protein translocase protein TatA